MADARDFNRAVAAVHVLPVGRTADQTHEYIHDQGFLCEVCGHRHAGAVVRFICVGCKCTHQVVTLVEFDRMRVTRFQAELTPDLFEGVTPARPPMPQKPGVH